MHSHWNHPSVTYQREVCILWCSCWLGLNTRGGRTTWKISVKMWIFPQFFRVKIKTCILNHLLVNVFPFESLVGKINKNLPEIKTNVLKLTANTSEKWFLLQMTGGSDGFKGLFSVAKTVSFREGSLCFFSLGLGPWLTVGQLGWYISMCCEYTSYSTPKLMEAQIHGEKKTLRDFFPSQDWLTSTDCWKRNGIKSTCTFMDIHIYIYSMD